MHAVVETPTYLTDAKQRADISQAERNALRTIVITLADLYRQGIAGRIREGGSSSGE